MSKNTVTVSYKGRSNFFHLFGGKDEGSASLIQGITFAGVLMDEVALQPRSFVEQACARCSVTGSKFWFNCNPESPGALVLQGVDKEHRRAQRPVSPFYHEGQPVTVRRDQKAV